MAVIETRQYTESQWLKYEEGQDSNKGITRSSGIISLTAGDTLVTGTVLGQITATGKWVVSDSGAVDGSEVPAAIFIRGYDDIDVKQYAIDAETTGDYKGVILTRGTAIVAKQSLILDASWSGNEQAVYDALTALQINVDEQV